MPAMKRGLIAMPRTHTESIAVTHRSDASFRPDVFHAGLTRTVWISDIFEIKGP